MLEKVSMHYLTNLYMKYDGMLPNYACCGGLEAYQRGVSILFGENCGKTYKCFGRHQRIISSMHRWGMVVCYLIMPFGMA